MEYTGEDRTQLGRYLWGMSGQLFFSSVAAWLNVWAGRREEEG